MIFDKDRILSRYWFLKTESLLISNFLRERIYHKFPIQDERFDFTFKFHLKNLYWFYESINNIPTSLQNKLPSKHDYQHVLWNHQLRKITLSHYSFNQKLCVKLKILHSKHINHLYHPKTLNWISSFPDFIFFIV